MAQVSTRHSQNAIDELALIIHFQHDIHPSEVESIKALSSDLTEFKHVEDVNTLTVNFDSVSAKQVKQRIGGVVLSTSETADKRAEWLIRVEGNRVIIACSDYSHWADIWAKAYSYFQELFKLIRIETNPIIEVAFQCTDKLSTLATKASEEYSNRINFDESSIFLPKGIFKRERDVWHVHQGWFEKFPTNACGIEVGLHNLNIGTQWSDDYNIHLTTISHLVRYRDLSIALTEDFISQTIESGILSQMMNEAHKYNKAVLLDLLNKERLDQIGLKESKNV
jgi:hypothetical protein